VRIVYDLEIPKLQHYEPSRRGGNMPFSKRMVELESQMEALVNRMDRLEALVDGISAKLESIEKLLT
jgi:hypothetical protein